MNYIGRSRKFGAFLGTMVLPVVLVAGGCSSDGSDNAAFCADVTSVQSDLDALKSMDISISNAAKVGSAVEELGTDVNSLVSATADVASDNVDNLQDAMRDLSESVTNLGDSSTVADVNTAVTNVTTAFNSVQSGVDCS